MTEWSAWVESSCELSQLWAEFLVVVLFGGNALIEQEVPQCQFIIDVKAEVLEVEDKPIEMNLVLNRNMEVSQPPIVLSEVLNNRGGKSSARDKVL